MIARKYVSSITSVKQLKNSAYWLTFVFINGESNQFPHVHSVGAVFLKHTS